MLFPEKSHFFQGGIANLALPVLRSKRKTRLIQSLTSLLGYKKRFALLTGIGIRIALRSRLCVF